MFNVKYEYNMGLTSNNQLTKAATYLCRSNLWNNWSHFYPKEDNQTVSTIEDLGQTNQSL